MKELGLHPEGGREALAAIPVSICLFIFTTWGRRASEATTLTLEKCHAAGGVPGGKQMGLRETEQHWGAGEEGRAFCLLM